jgi:tripartite ATP-independent transporter DctP family solute receptor
MYRAVRVFVVLATLCWALLAAGTARAGDAAFEMKIATVAPDQTPWSELLKHYKKKVEEKSGGRIKVKVFMGGILGDENESVVKCRRGQVQGIGVSTGALASAVPEINVLELPYLFRSFAEADYVIDQVLTVPFEPIVRKYGLVLGFWSENGFRQFGTRGSFVKTAADLKGKKMRSQESSVHLDAWKILGASPIPIPTTEVLTALQNRTVDGFDQSLLYTVATSWYKSVTHVTLSNHIYQPGGIVFNQEWFDKLPADLQKLLIDEGRALQVKGRKAIRKINPDLQALLVEGGVKVYELSDAEKLALEKATLPVRASFRKRQGAESAKLLDAVEKALVEFRAGKVK